MTTVWYQPIAVTRSAGYGVCMYRASVPFELRALPKQQNAISTETPTGDIVDKQNLGSTLQHCEKCSIEQPIEGDIYARQRCLIRYAYRAALYGTI
jgi:hypothetical protein